MGLECFRHEKEKYRNDYINFDVVASQVLSSRIDETDDPWAEITNPRIAERQWEVGYE